MKKFKVGHIIIARSDIPYDRRNIGKIINISEYRYEVHWNGDKLHEDKILLNTSDFIEKEFILLIPDSGLADLIYDF